MTAITVLKPDDLSAHPAPVRVVLLGLGTVGGGVYQLLARRPDSRPSVRWCTRRCSANAPSSRPTRRWWRDAGVSSAVSRRAAIRACDFRRPSAVKSRCWKRFGIEGVASEDIAAARAANRRLRLVATCAGTADQVSGKVGVETLASNDYLAGAAGEENRVEIETRGGETIRLAGKGAGRWPTAGSVLSDVHAHLRAQLTVH